MAKKNFDKIISDALNKKPHYHVDLIVIKYWHLYFNKYLQYQLFS